MLLTCMRAVYLKAACMARLLFWSFLHGILCMQGRSCLAELHLPQVLQNELNYNAEEQEASIALFLSQCNSEQRAVYDARVAAMNMPPTDVCGICISHLALCSAIHADMIVPGVGASVLG